MRRIFCNQGFVMFLVALAVLVLALRVASAAPCPTDSTVDQSPLVMDVWLWRSQLIEPWHRVWALDTNDAIVGVTITLPTGNRTAALLLHIYGDYPDTPEDEGLDSGESCWFLYDYGDGYCGPIDLLEAPKFENRAWPQLQVFMPGDIDRDGDLDIIDFIAVGNVAFRGAPYFDWHDVTGDGEATIADVILLGAVIFGGVDPWVLRW